MGFTFILLLAPQQMIPALAPYRIALLTAVVAVITHVYDRLRRGQPIVRLTREMWIAVCLLGWAFLTVPFSYWPGGSLSFLFEVYVKAIIVFWLLAGCVDDPRRLHRTVWALSLMGCFIALAAIRQYLSGEFIPIVNVKRIGGYNAPLTANPNDLALMLNLILPLSVALFLTSTKPLVRLRRRGSSRPRNTSVAGHWSRRSSAAVARRRLWPSGSTRIFPAGGR